MTSNQGDIPNHLLGARQEVARGNCEFIALVKLSTEFGNEPSSFQVVTNTAGKLEQLVEGNISEEQVDMMSAFAQAIKENLNCSRGIRTAD